MEILPWTEGWRTLKSISYKGSMMFTLQSFICVYTGWLGSVWSGSSLLKNSVYECRNTGGKNVKEKCFRWMMKFCEMPSLTIKIIVSNPLNPGKSRCHREPQARTTCKTERKMLPFCQSCWCLTPLGQGYSVTPKWSHVDACKRLIHVKLKQNVQR